MEHFFQNIHGWSRPEDQGILLSMILSNINTNEKVRIAEVGVFLGRCTSMWNVELINKNIEYEYYAIDHFLGSSEHEKGVDYYSECVRNLSPILEKIKIIKNDSVSESKNYPDNFFDVVYIDASHEYEFVKQDILHWLPKVKKGGFICGDDYHPGWPGVVKAVDEILKDTIKIYGNTQWYTIKNNL